MYISTQYYNLQSRKEIAFQCEENALVSGLCIFHDKQYQKRHKEEFATKLNQKIEKSISQKSPLRCIGYPSCIKELIIAISTLSSFICKT